MTLPGSLDRHLTLSLQPKTLSGFQSARKCSSMVRYPPSVSLAVVVKCVSSSEQPEGGSGLKNALSGIVDKRVELLLEKEENKDLLDNLSKASERVEIAKLKLAEIEKQELEAQQMRLYVQQLEAQAAEIAECEKEVQEAKALVEEAEKTLSSNLEMARGETSKDEERLESVKAASISALVGTLAALPIYLAKPIDSPQLLLQLGVVFASCALFGVTFRYAVRRDLDNIQLKTGTAAAFAFVKGLATLSGGAPLELSADSFLSHALDGALFVSKDLLVFIFAAISLDFCFKSGIVSPFGTRENSE